MNPKEELFSGVRLMNFELHELLYPYLSPYLESSQPLFLQISFLSSSLFTSGTLIIHKLFLLMTLHRSCTFLHSFKFLFSLFSSGWIVSKSLKLSILDSLFCLIHSDVDVLYYIFNSFILLFSSRMSCGFMISITLLNFLFYSCSIVFLI